MTRPATRPAHPAMARRALICFLVLLATLLGSHPNSVAAANPSTVSPTFRVLGLPTGTRAVAGTADPQSWQGKCSAGKLGLEKVKVELAPVLSGPAGDKTPTGGTIVPTPDSRGRWVPVVMIHGWTSSSTHDPARTGTFSHKIDLTANRISPTRGDRSLIGQLQGIPGAAVFTYDYHDYSASWVDDPHLGPGLGKLVDCLYRASGREKVILVGHSMGGLISRYAASHEGYAGPTRAAEISLAVTFGTPETGSLVAQIAALVVDPKGALAGLTGVQANLLPVQASVLGSILSVCGDLSSANIDTGTVCDVLPRPVSTFSSEAGVALRYGSAKLRALKRWPSSVVVDAVAGDTEFTIPKVGWFAKPWDVREVPMGDVIVTTDSALSGADLTKRASCAYQLSIVRGVTDRIGLQVGNNSQDSVADQPFGAFSGPCFHTSLMRGRELTNEAMGAVADDIASRQPPPATGLARGWKGVLPGQDLRAVATKLGGADLINASSCAPSAMLYSETTWPQIVAENGRTIDFVEVFDNRDQVGETPEGKRWAANDTIQGPMGIRVGQPISKFKSLTGASQVVESFAGGVDHSFDSYWVLKAHDRLYFYVRADAETHRVVSFGWASSLAVAKERGDTQGGCY